MQNESVPALKIFISYSHKSMDWKNEIADRLSKTGNYEILCDDILRPGDEWDTVLTRHRSEADLFLLLVSESYLTSQKINTKELPQIMERGTNGEAYVIPIILEDCGWSNMPFARFQAVPKYGRPINRFENKEEAMVQITDAVLSIEQLKQNKKALQIIKKEKEKPTGVLNLSECNLRSIPRELLEMPWLTELNLEKNYITKIEQLDQLQQLKNLNLSKNEIETLEGLEELKALQFLDLEYNKVSRIQNLENLTALEILGLSSNKIEKLEGISQLTRLHTLYIGHNQLKEITALSTLSSLTRIILTNNQITSIRPLLQHIKNGLKIALHYSYNDKEQGIFIKDNNTLAEPSAEVIEKGRLAVLKYFEDADTYGTRKLEVFKLILVGNSKVGKTNFSEFLREQSITEAHNSTHLLDIQAWDASFLKAPSGKPMRVNIFDFGGQDYYHDSHRMYYSHDTAYILLWDTATNKYSEERESSNENNNESVYENFPLEYWLESIQYNLADKYRHLYNGERREKAKQENQGNSSPVLILQNKIDIEEGLLDQKRLTEQYKNIAGFFNMSLRAKKRTAVLYEVLDDYIRSFNLSGRLLIKYEHKIVQNFIDHPREFKLQNLDEFHQECRNIIQDGTTAFNKDNARIIAEILNALGIIFYDKQSENEGIIFTRINRLNELIKEIMEVAKNGNDKGLFNLKQVAHIPFVDDLVKLLSKNKSIIPINQQEFLVPQFLPLQPDPSVHFFLHAFIHNQVRFIYKAYFHKTLLLSLYSKYMNATLESYGAQLVSLPFWRNGIIISKGEGANKQMVFVEFVKTDTMGTINIKTMKPFNKRGLEKEIETTLDELNRGWTVSKEISTDSVNFFDAKYLVAEVKNLRYEFAAGGSLFSVNDFKHIMDFEKLPKKLFISYSSRNAAFIKRFITHLEILKAAGLIDPWYDRMIESGTKWDDSIRAEMRSSDVIIFLLSPDFLATEYIMKTEIPLAIEQHKNDVSKFFFIELQPCGWKRTEIANYQQTDDAHDPTKNVICIGQPENDQKWNLVIDELVAKMDA